MEQTLCDDQRIQFDKTGELSAGETLFADGPATNNLHNVLAHFYQIDVAAHRPNPTLTLTRTHTLSFGATRGQKAPRAAQQAFFQKANAPQSTYHSSSGKRPCTLLLQDRRANSVSLSAHTPGLTPQSIAVDEVLTPGLVTSGI